MDIAVHIRYLCQYKHTRITVPYLPDVVSNYTDTFIRIRTRYKQPNIRIHRIPAPRADYLLILYTDLGIPYNAVSPV